MSTDDLLSAALHLPPRAREELANTLLDSLYPANAGDAQVSESWVRELNARIRALEEGRMRGIPADEALAQIRERLARRAG